MIFKSGMGSALMRGRGSKFERVVRSMSHVLDIPLSIKLRTGIQQGNPNAHELIPKIKIWGANLITVSALWCTECNHSSACVLEIFMIFYCLSRSLGAWPI